jgi:hypothetical protein
MDEQRPPWARAGCMVGAPTEPCGLALYGAMAVNTIPDADHPDDIRPGVILLCRFHFDGLSAKATR